MVADYARTVLLDYDSLRVDLNDLRGVRRALLRVAVVESMVSEAPLAAMSSIRARCEDVSFKLRMLPAPQVTEAVKTGVVDLGITFSLPPDPAISVLLQLPEPVVVALPTSHVLAQKERITLAELRTLPMALPDVDFGIRKVLDRATRAQGFELVPVLSSSSFEAMRDFVRQGLGGALLTSRSTIRDERLGALKTVVIDEPALGCATVELIALKNRRMPRVMKLFVEELMESLQSAAEHLEPAVEPYEYAALAATPH
jgi:DNA-binding transcriptional LysR family regulator